MLRKVDKNDQRERIRERRKEEKKKGKRRGNQRRKEHVTGAHKPGTGHRAAGEVDGKRKTRDERAETGKGKGQERERERERQATNVIYILHLH